MPEIPGPKPGDDLSRAAAHWVRLHARLPAVLFHYTPAPGLMGILNTGRLWATNARFMNDPSEIQYAASMVEAILKEASKKHEEEVGKLAGGIFERAFTFLRDAKYKVPKIEAWTQNAISVFDDQGGAYICCFCRQSDLLSQWRGYGAVGGGYAIGFRSKSLSSGAADVFLRKVIYNRQTQQQIVKRWVDGVFALDLQWRRAHKESIEAAAEKVTWQSFLESLKTAGQGQKQLSPAVQEGLSRLREGLSRLNEGMDRFSQFLAECLVCFKDPAYYQEEEWRLIQFGKSGPKLLFRAGKGHLIPYTELTLASVEGKPKLPIESITYGPVLEAAMAKRSLKMILSSNGYHEVVGRVRSSRIPYRG